MNFHLRLGYDGGHNLNLDFTNSQLMNIVLDLIVFHNKMDHAKTICPWFARKMNCKETNKYEYMFCTLSLLIAKQNFKEVFVSFLVVKHIRDDIDVLFGCWSMKLYEEFQPFPFLMKSYMDLNNMQIIIHLIEEVFDFITFIKPFILNGCNRLVGQTKPQQF